MKSKALLIPLVLAALACVTAPALAQPKETPLVASTINGPSEILKKGSNTWVKAKLRYEVAEGDGARALPGGRFVLRTTSGHAIRMAQLTQLFVAEPGAGVPASDRAVRIKQDGGWIWVAVLPLSVTRTAVEVELNALGDSPLVSIERDRLLSTGNFHPMGLALAF